MQISNEIDTYTRQLSMKLTTEQMTRIKKWSKIAAKAVAETTKEKQIQKFNNLLSQKFGQKRLDNDKVVRNLS